jgi:hypothetical protein
MLDFMKRDDLISMKHLSELIHSLNKKQEVEEDKRVNTWLVVGLVTLGLVLAGLIVYKLFFSSKDDEYDDYDDDFEDLDYEDDFDDFEDEDLEEDLEDFDDEDLEDLEDLDGFEDTEKFEE